MIGGLGSIFGDTELRDTLTHCIICAAVVKKDAMQRHVTWHVKTDTLGEWTLDLLKARGDRIQRRAQELFAEQGRSVHRDKTWDEIDDRWRDFWMMQAAEAVGGTPSP